MREDAKARFWAKVNKEPGDGCWTWTAAKGRRGYGLFTVLGILRPAHRVSWEMANGAIPNGLLVLHRCDVPGCIRPDHLFLGTHADNMADRYAKGRNQQGDDHYSRREPGRLARGDRNGARLHPDRIVPPRGAKNGMATLTEADVLEIRRMCAAGLTRREVAAKWGISAGHVTDICTGKRWGHVTEGILPKRR